MPDDGTAGARRPRVLVALDEDQHSLHAGEEAHRLFGDGAAYIAVNVGSGAAPWIAPGMVWGSGYGWVPPASSLDDPEHDLELAHDTAEHAARQAGLPHAEAVGHLGDPAQAILAVADERDVDVIVVGAHTRSWWERLVGPSVSSAIVRDAHRPVLVVPER